MEEKVLLSKKDHIAVITLNQPNSLNALNADMLSAIEKAVDEVNSDKDIYVLILTGAGKAFVAGADIKEMQPLSPMEALPWGSIGRDLFTKIEHLRIPVIAAINGFALGGGCELALSCDIRIASEKAKFGQPEVGLGIIPGFGGTQRLPRVVGVGKAKELIYTGKVIGAEEAHQIGLVNSVVPAEELLQAAEALANAIALNAQHAVQEAKKAINTGIEVDALSGLDYEAQAFALCFATKDQKAGMEAFVNKAKDKNFKYE